MDVSTIAEKLSEFALTLAGTVSELQNVWIAAYIEKYGTIPKLVERRDVSASIRFAWTLDDTGLALRELPAFALVEKAAVEAAARKYRLPFDPRDAEMRLCSEGTSLAIVWVRRGLGDGG